MGTAQQQSYSSKLMLAFVRVTVEMAKYAYVVQFSAC